jgi:hypothetical protein
LELGSRSAPDQQQARQLESENVKGRNVRVRVDSLCWQLFTKLIVNAEAEDARVAAAKMVDFMLS